MARPSPYLEPEEVAIETLIDAIKRGDFRDLAVGSGAFIDRALNWCWNQHSRAQKRRQVTDAKARSKNPIVVAPDRVLDESKYVAWARKVCHSNVDRNAAIVMFLVKHDNYTLEEACHGLMSTSHYHRRMAILKERAQRLINVSDKQGTNNTPKRFLKVNEARSHSSREEDP